MKALGDGHYFRKHCPPEIEGILRKEIEEYFKEFNAIHLCDLIYGLGSLSYSNSEHWVRLSDKAKESLRLLSVDNILDLAIGFSRADKGRVKDWQEIASTLQIYIHDMDREQLTKMASAFGRVAFGKKSLWEALLVQFQSEMDSYTFI